MIELLKEVTRNLVLLLLLATFLEMLLPKSHLSRYIRFVVGLFVLLTILHPLTGLLDRQGTLRLPLGEPPQEQLEVMIKRGVLMGEYQQQTALLAAKERLEQQLEAMIYMVHGTDGVKVDLILENHRETGPRIKQAVILISWKDPQEPLATNRMSAIEPVLIGEGTGRRSEKEEPGDKANMEREQLREKVAGGISAYLGLDRSQILIDFAE
ncbi:MAG: stage III sporulation protein AF [Clostridia bacterium]|nr:stage III sporulation protein AF [Clostridia bacterium]